MSHRATFAVGLALSRRRSEPLAMLAEVEPWDHPLSAALSIQRSGITLPTRGRWTIDAGNGTARLDGFVPTGDDRPDIHIEVRFDLERHANPLSVAAETERVLLIEDANRGDIGVKEVGLNSIELADVPDGGIHAAVKPYLKPAAP